MNFNVGERPVVGPRKEDIIPQKMTPIGYCYAVHRREDYNAGV